MLMKSKSKLGMTGAIGDHYSKRQKSYAEEFESLIEKRASPTGNECNGRFCLDLGPNTPIEEYVGNTSAMYFLGGISPIEPGLQVGFWDLAFRFTAELAVPRSRAGLKMAWPGIDRRGFSTPGRGKHIAVSHSCVCIRRHRF